MKLLMKYISEAQKKISKYDLRTVDSKGFVDGQNENHARLMEIAAKVIRNKKW